MLKAGKEKESKKEPAVSEAEKLSSLAVLVEPQGGRERSASGGPQR